MKNTLLVAASLLLAGTYAGGQTPTVTINGTVSANGTITGNGVNSSGSAAGQLGLTQGIAPANVVTNSFSLAAPLTISSAFQSVVPAASASGIWRGTQAVTATATAAVMSTSISSLTVTSGSGYSGGGPSCSIAGGTMAGTCSGTLTSGSVTAITVSGGAGYLVGAVISFGPPGSGTTASGVLTAVGGGGSASTAVPTSGSGYATAPACLITGSNTMQATCTAAITNGQVSGLTITNAGMGYSTAGVTFVPQIAMGFAVTGDDATTNASTNAVVVTGVHGVAYPASPASTNTVPVVTSTGSGGAVTYEQVTSAMTDSSIRSDLESDPHRYCDRPDAS